MSLPTLSILIPAAGASERLGQPKQLVTYRGKSLLQNTINTANSIGPGEILVVTGAHAKNVRTEAEHPNVRWIHNEDWSKGMGGSIAKGVTAIDPDSTAVMIVLCDQWRIQTPDLDQLVKAWQSCPGQIICSHVEGVSMPPVIFPSTFFASLRKLTGDQGARRMIDANADLLIPVAIRNARHDLDTQTQLAHPKKNPG